MSSKPLLNIAHTQIKMWPLTLQDHDLLGLLNLTLRSDFEVRVDQ